jgi:hypothetical protein
VKADPDPASAEHGEEADPHQLRARLHKRLSCCLLRVLLRPLIVKSLGGLKRGARMRISRA